MFLSEQRKGEIAYAMLIEDFRRKQHTLLRTDILKKIGKFSKTLSSFKISKEEIFVLYRDIIFELVQTAFNQKSFWNYEVKNQKSDSLSTERRGEIALRVWKLSIKEKMISLDKNDFDRRIGNVVKILSEYKISKEELMSLYHELLQEAMQEIFNETFTL